METLNEIIRTALIQKGASIVGFADLIDIPAEFRHNLRYGISIAVALEADIIENYGGSFSTEKFEKFQKYKQLPFSLALDAAKIIEAYGYDVIPLVGDNVVVDKTTLSTKLPHKTIATRAGVGWIGKCTQLITKQYGSGIRLSSLLTNAPLHTGKPINFSSCGKCTVCKDACPGNAPSDIEWNINLTREMFFNIDNCRKTRSELASKTREGTFLCGICVKNCPWTRKHIAKLKKH